MMCSIVINWQTYPLQTPPSMYRRQVDVQYNSLPRQSFPTLVQSAANNNNGSVNADLDTPTSQQTTPKQRTVAFGNGFMQSDSSYSTPTIHNAANLEGGGVFARTGATSNIYHHQLILGQPGQLRGFEKQRGYSVPNLGASILFFLTKNVTVCRCCCAVS